MSRKYQLKGQRFGKLTVIRENGRGKSGGIAWLCQCDCGNQVTVEGHALVRGNNKSCGCSHGEKHGLSNDRLYSVWQTMKRRCDLPTSEKYKAYGGRGIKVCEEWASSFTAFRTWALENGYDYDAPYGVCTIDRIDVNGNYEPSNCRWITHKEQCNNTRRNHLITYKGRTQNLKQWCDELNLSYNVIATRIITYHWSIEKAFETEGNPNKRMLTYKGKTQNLNALCRELGIKQATLSLRLKAGWSVERALSKV